MRYATCLTAITSEKTWDLFFARSLKHSAALVALLLVASALAYGNSIASADSGPPPISRKTQTITSVSRPAVSSQEFAGFDSALRGAHRYNATIVMTKTNSSRSGEIAREEESTTALPEPGTGILLSIGMLIAFNLRGKWAGIKPLN